MERRTRLSVMEVIEVMRLIADVAAARGDASAQQAILAAGLQRLVGATVGFAGHCDGWWSEGEPRFVGMTLMDGSASVFDDYARLVLGSPDGLDSDPYCRLSTAHEGPSVLISQGEALSRTRGHSDVFRAWVDHLRVADGLVGVIRLQGEGGRAAAVSMQRLDDRRGFSARQRALAELAVGELARLAACGHLAFPLPPKEDPSAALSPRQRQMLQLLLTGRHVKGIARDLGLSAWTARDHIKAIYRRLNVTSREELMARCLQRRE